MEWNKEQAVLSPIEIEIVKKFGGERHDIKVRAGYSKFRKDGSLFSRDTMVEATGAEYVGVARLGQIFNYDILLHGDGGRDCTFEGMGVEVYRPGRDDYAIITGVGPEYRHRHADLYMAVTGSTNTGHYVVHGVISHAKLVRLPLVDFKWGPRHAAKFESLTPVPKFLEIIKASNVRPAELLRMGISK
jgi:hypothetical protein